MLMEEYGLFCLDLYVNVFEIVGSFS